MAVATIASAVLEKQLSVTRAVEQGGREKILFFWERRKVNKECGSKRGQIALSVVYKSLPSLLVLLAGGVAMGSLEGWSWQDSIYYSFITAGTLGYGDFSPVTQKGRVLAVVFIPLAVGTTGKLLGGVTSWMIQRRQERFYKVQMEREMDVDRLLQMDADNNHRVSREEYVEFMLKQMQLADDDLFRELHSQFDKLDADNGGYLDRRDLRLMIERRQKEQADQERGE